jgi:hypothetical protein
LRLISIGHAPLFDFYQSAFNSLPEVMNQMQWVKESLKKQPVQAFCKGGRLGLQRDSADCIWDS